MSASTNVVRAPELRTGHPSATLVGTVMAVVIVLWGLGPPITKLISAPPLAAVSVRFWLSIPVIWAVVYLSGRRMSWMVLRRTALAGALFGINLAFVFAALQEISVAIMSVIQALQPGLVLVVAGPWLGERATGWHVAWTAVGAGGAAIVVLGGDPDVSVSAVGVLYGATAVVTFTGFYLLSARVRSTTAIDPLQLMAGVTLFAGITITPIALLAMSPDDYGQIGGADWAYLGFIALFLGLVSHTLMSWAHRFIPASRSSLYLLALNLVSVAAAWPLHDEPVTLVQALGGLIVLGAVAAVVTRPTTVVVPDPPATIST